MTPKKIAELDTKYSEMIKSQCHTDDNERDHVVADELLVLILMELGCNKTAEAHEDVSKWYA